MRIIAIDPGYDRMGVAIMEGNAIKPTLIYSECVVTNRKDSSEKRLWAIADKLDSLIKKYKPDLMAIESLFFSVNQKTAIGVAEARGIIMMEAGRNKLEVVSLNPNTVKVAVTGYGASNKKAVTDMVKRLVETKENVEHDDEYDAIAIGIATLAIHKNRDSKFKIQE
mgnify:CR=1 FL=1